ncbi:MAG: glycosyltransferase [Algicola sp.]|nr:glycosyltransferase [Algicola sp.]
MNNNKTTIQVVQHLVPGGIETMALDLQQFSQDVDNSYIISLEGTKSELCERWPRLIPRADRIICLNKPSGLSWQTIAELIEIFTRLKPEVVHTHHIGPLLYGGLAAKKAGVKTIVHTEHDAWHLQSLKRRILAKSLLRIVRPVLVADAEVVALEMVKHLKIPPPLVIPNGIDTQRFIPGDKAQARAQLGLPEDAIVIGCAARLIAIKGHKTLLEAVQHMPEDVHLVLAGQGEEEQALKQIVQTCMDGMRVHFLGNIDDMPGFYQAIDIFCLPSFKEGYPLTPLEAQSCGVPVVASDTGGVKETLCPLTGRLVPVGDADQLRVALQQLIVQLFGAVAIESFGQTVRNFVIGNNDVRQMASRYHSLGH